MGENLGNKKGGCKEGVGSSEAAAIYCNGCSASISPWGSEKVASDVDLAHGQSGMWGLARSPP